MKDSKKVTKTGRQVRDRRKRDRDRDRDRDDDEEDQGDEDQGDEDQGDAITITSGLISGSKFGWTVAKGTQTGYIQGGSLSIDPIPDQFIAIFSTVSGLTSIWVKTGTTAPATLEVDGVSYPITNSFLNGNGSLWWGGFDQDRYYTTGDPLAFTEAGATKQIRIFDADGNVLLGSLASP